MIVNHFIFTTMKKIYTLIFVLLISFNLFAVKVTLKVDMTGQDVSKGVYLTGEINAWVFTPMTSEGKNIYIQPST